MQEDIVIIATPFHPVKWGSFIARGLLALIIGILVLIWTGIAVQVVVTLIGILIILAAILALVLALKPPPVHRDPSCSSLWESSACSSELQTILYRWIAAEALTVIIALLMLFFGFIDLSIAIFHPEYTRHRFLLVFSGAISIILGGVFFFLPAFGAIVLVAVYLGIFAIIYGILSIAIGVMVKREQKKVTSG